MSLPSRLPAPTAAPASAPVRVRIPCRFFHTPSGCAKGDACRFAHGPVAADANNAAAPIPKPRKPRHRPAPAPASVPGARAAPAPVPDTLLAVELRALQDRFRASFTTVAPTPLALPSARDAGSAASIPHLPATVVEFAIPPSDPDFPFDLDALRIRLIVPTRPNTLAPISRGAADDIPPLSATDALEGSRIKVLNHEIPVPLSVEIENAFRSKLRMLLANPRLSVPGTILLSAANWLDSQLENLLAGTTSHEPESVGNIRFVVNNARSDQELRESVLARINAVFSDLQSMTPKTATNAEFNKSKVFYYGVPVSAVGGDPHRCDEESETGSEFGESDSDASESSAAALVSSLAVSSERRGTQINVANYFLDGISLLECTRPKFLMSCVRCKAYFDSPPVVPGTPVLRSCTACTQQQSIQFRPALVHENSTVVGYLDLDGVAIVDLLPSAWKVTCTRCNGVTQSVGVLKSLPRGDFKMSVSCLDCHSQMRIMIKDVLFAELSPSAPPASRANGPILKKKVTDASIVQGLPLPRNGACEHYRKSYRWFRFPCCGRAYPCDQCHESNKPDTHEMEWATRMICGFCAREQAYAAQPPACACGRELLRRSVGGFWEGGTGTRSRVLMSTKDTRKHKGLGKTASQKASRVGKKE
ncbi:hypothetical protein HDU84_009064 [Entophlyctis sp. JEL0112]|nr:hypothetical protein HDU84_009064 [Entophlyctis sp. JEL0112]